MPTQGRTIQTPRVVSHEQWINERMAFLAKEKEFTRLKDELSRQRRELAAAPPPGVQAADGMAFQVGLVLRQRLQAWVRHHDRYQG